MGVNRTGAPVSASSRLQAGRCARTRPCPRPWRRRLARRCCCGRCRHSHAAAMRRGARRRGATRAVGEPGASASVAADRSLPRTGSPGSVRSMPSAAAYSWPSRAYTPAPASCSPTWPMRSPGVTTRAIASCERARGGRQTKRRAVRNATRLALGCVWAPPPLHVFENDSGGERCGLGATRTLHPPPPRRMADPPPPPHLRPRTTSTSSAPRLPPSSPALDRARCPRATRARARRAPSQCGRER